MKPTLAAIALLIAAPLARAADAPLPKMTGQVGDSITFKSVKTISGQKAETNLRVTLTELNDQTAAVAAKMMIEGLDPANLPVIPIPGIAAGVGLDPAALPDNTYSKLEEKPTVLGTGQEQLTVAGKKLDCTWVEQKVTTAAGSVVTKYWLSKAVPVTGLVKATVAQTVPGLGEVKTVYELVNFEKK